MLAGIILNAAYFGLSGMLASGAGLVVTVFVLLAPFSLGGIGGGDVKMMGAIGALLGPRLGIVGLAFGMVLGGAIMVVHLALRGRLREKLEGVVARVSLALLGASLDPLKLSPADAGAVHLPYSIPLGLGTVAALACAGAGSWR